MNTQSAVSLQQFDWDLVRSFLAAMNHGSLLGAARALKSSQPTMGRRIGELEAQLGVALFERTGRGLRPTAMALALVDSARQMEEAALKLAQGLTQQQQTLKGTVRITASTTVSCFVLPQIIAAMRADLPDIEIELVSSNAVSNLLKREADIAVRMVPPEQSSLTAKRIGHITLGAYASEGYLRRHGTPRTPGDLLHHALIGIDQDSSIIDGFKAQGVHLDKHAFCVRTDDLIAYWELVRTGAGIGFVGTHLARQDPTVQRVLPTLPLPTLPMWLAVHREVHGNGRIRAVYNYLAAALPQALLGSE
jgi:DNA-binding transcriptional LysR family regulator